MRDFQLQTPQRDQTPANRRSKSTSEHSKNACKVTTKKSLNHAFKAASEAALVPPKEMLEVWEDNPFGESVENFLTSVNPADTDSSETAAISDLTSASLSPSSLIISDKHVASNAMDIKCENAEVDSFTKIESIEVDLVIKHLREARIQVLKSKDVDHSKKLLDAMINVIIKEFYGGRYEENEWLDKLLSRKSNLILVSLVLVMYAISMFWFFSKGVEGFTGAPPT